MFQSFRQDEIPSKGRRKSNPNPADANPDHNLNLISRERNVWDNCPIKINDGFRSDGQFRLPREKHIKTDQRDRQTDRQADTDLLDSRIGFTSDITMHRARYVHQL